MPCRFAQLYVRLPPEVEASACFIVAGALMNVVKPRRATSAEVRAAVDDGTLGVEVRDDGVGGADPEGHGCWASAIVSRRSEGGCVSTGARAKARS